MYIRVTVHLGAQVFSSIDVSIIYIIYIDVSQVIISKKYCISISEDPFVLANSADPDKMPPSVAFHLGFHSLQKYPFRGFQSDELAQQRLSLGVSPVLVS